MTTTTTIEAGSLIPFDYQGSRVRTVLIDDEPWFVLADLCKVLGIVRSASAVSERLEDGVRRTYPIVDALGRTQNATVVNESGMYRVVLRSDKPEALAFQAWITNDVLPSIRKRGGYLTPEATERVLTDPDFIIRLATSLKEERAARAQAEAQRAELTAKVEQDAPKVLFADAVTTSKSNILVGDLAKILRGNGVQVGANRLFEVLRRRGYLVSHKGTDWNMPTQRAMELGLFKIKETAVTHSDGHVTVSRTPKVTGKGQAYFVARILDGRLSLSMDENTEKMLAG